MSSQKNRPALPAKCREFDSVDSARVVLSRAERRGIVQGACRDYYNATVTHDYEALELYHSKVVPLLRRLLRQHNPTKIYLQWQPHAVLIKHRTR